MRLAYKELEIDRKMEEKKLQNLEGKKREQAERLGMGFGGRRYGFCFCAVFSSSQTFVAALRFPLQRRVTLSDVRDAGDRAGNSRGSQVLLSLQTGHVR